MEERPIDRGWAWMICLGVGINSLFLSGPLRSYGILFVEISERFNASGSVASIVLCMISVGVAITSPIAATLGERYGQRIVIAVGGILTFVGAFLTAFAPNVVYVCVIFGIFSGLGLGCMFAPAMVMIGYYFEKRRSFANGLSMAGGSIGQMTIPVLFTYLMDTYSFQGAMLIFSALLLHIVVGALLLRPITSYKPVTPKAEISKKTENMKADEVTKTTKTTLHTVLGDGEQESESQETHELLDDQDIKKTQSLYNLSIMTDLDSHLRRDMGKSLPSLDNGLDAIVPEKQTSRTGSLYLLPDQTLAPNEVAQVEQQHVSIIYEQNPPKNGLKSCLMFFLNLYDWSLFKDRVWIVYAISVTTGQSGYGVTCMFLPPFAAEKGIAPYWVSLLMSIAGATTFVGRIGGGAFADLGLLKRYTLTSICLVIMGVATFIQPLLPYYPVMVGFACILGFIGGVYVAQIVSVVIEIMGIKKMSSSFGLALMVSGLIQIPVPITYGILKDYTGTYDWAMYSCSFMLFAGAASLFAAGRLADRKAAKP